jgi:DNA-binding NarL/FixJ family response regulator
MNLIRIVIVDDHPMVRHGLKSFLDLSDDIEVCAEASSGEEALQVVKQVRPEVVLMDLSMPGIGGIEGTQLLRQQHPHLKIIALTSHSEEDVVVKALQAGANSYLLKTCSPDRLETAIRDVVQGKSTIDPAVTHILVGQMQRPKEKQVEALTPREKEVLYWIAQGRSNKEIGEVLHIGIKTVKTHVSHLLEKLQLTDRTQLAIYAHENDLHRNTF